MCVCVQMPMSMGACGGKGVRSPGARVTVSCSHQMGWYWELNSGLIEEQCWILMTEPSVSPAPICIFLNV